MSKVNQDSLELCKRLDALLENATNDGDALYEFASENEEILKYAFLARAVVRGLINPLPELISSISEIEADFYEFASQIEADEDEDEDEDEEGDE